MAVATLGITTTFSVGIVATTAVQVCATNTLRRGLILENTGAGTLYFGFGTGGVPTTAMHALVIATATLGTNRVVFGPISPEFRGIVSIPANVPTGDVSLIALTTTGQVSVTEF